MRANKETRRRIARKSFMAVCSCHVTYAFQSESTLYSCLNVKELLTRSRGEIWSLSDCNWTRAQNHLIRKRTLNHLKRTLNHLAKRLSVRLRTKWFWVRVKLESPKSFILNIFLKAKASYIWKQPLKDVS